METERRIAICVFRHGDQILAARGFDNHSNQFFYRPLGGALEPNEQPEEALQREILEETGLRIHRLELLGTIDNEFEYEGNSHREEVAVFDAKFRDDSVYSQGSVPILEDVWEGPAQWISLSSPPREPVYPVGLLGLLASAV